MVEGAGICGDKGTEVYMAHESVAEGQGVEESR